MPVLQPLRGLFIQPSGGGALVQIDGAVELMYSIIRNLADAGYVYYANGVYCFGRIAISNPEMVEYLFGLVAYGFYGNYDLIARYAVDKTNKAKRFKGCIFGGDQYGIAGYEGKSGATSLGAYVSTPRLVNEDTVALQYVPFVLGNIPTLNVANYIITTIGDG